MFIAAHLSMPVVNGSCPHEIESVLNRSSRGWESQIRKRPPVLCLRFLVSATIAPATLAALATCSSFPICAVRPDCPSWVSTSSAFFLCYWFFYCRVVLVEIHINNTAGKSHMRRSHGILAINTDQWGGAWWCWQIVRLLLYVEPPKARLTLATGRETTRGSHPVEMPERGDPEALRMECLAPFCLGTP